MSFLNNIFFPTETFTTANIDGLDEWMATLSNVNNIKCKLTNSDVDTSIMESDKMLSKIDLPESFPFSTSTTPRQDDPLFWCAFIAKYGDEEFNMISNKFKNREIEEKQKAIAYLKNHPRALKDTNMKISAVGGKEIQSGLMTNSKTTPDIFIALCCFYGIKTFIVNHAKQSFLEFNPDPMNEELPIHIINYSDNGTYSIDNVSSPESIASIISTYIKLETPYKPFKGISSYNITELGEMANKANINTTTTKLKKQVLFQAILDACEWK